MQPVATLVVLAAVVETAEAPPAPVVAVVVVVVVAVVLVTVVMVDVGVAPVVAVVTELVVGVAAEAIVDVAPPAELPRVSFTGAGSAEQADAAAASAPKQNQAAKCEAFMAAGPTIHDIRLPPILWDTGAHVSQASPECANARVVSFAESTSRIEASKGTCICPHARAPMSFTTWFRTLAVKAKQLASRMLRPETNH
jgi:hypothetical protein